MLSDDSLLTDQAYLTGVQYRTDANLAARQSIYSYQRPRVNLVSVVLDLAELVGTEVVADIGCGNGIYLAELARRGHAGQLIGADLSPGMIAAARSRMTGAGLVNGDAAALPFPDGVADVTLAPHMLYHLPDRPAAVREFRRITKLGGRLLVVLNCADHLGALRELIEAVAADFGRPAGGTWSEYQAMTLDKGARLLAGSFAHVEQHEFTGELLVPDAQPVIDYVASTWTAQTLPDPADFTTAVAASVPFGPDGLFRVKTHCGVLICW